jgi:hypothetical protein
MNFYVKLLLHSKDVTDVGVLEKIFGGKFEDILGNWKKLHKEEHHNMCTC